MELVVLELSLGVECMPVGPWTDTEHVVWAPRSAKGDTGDGAQLPTPWENPCIVDPWISELPARPGMWLLDACETAVRNACVDGRGGTAPRLSAARPHLPTCALPVDLLDSVTFLSV